MIKATDTKSSARQPQQKQQAGSTFFNKDRGDAFFGEKETAKDPFFVQRKLTIGKPDDHYEKQADHVADKVVQRMSQSPVVQAKAAPAVSAVAPGHVPSAAVQPAALQMKEKELKKEEEVAGEEKKVQRKPIFDSLADPPDDQIRRKPNEGDAPKESTSNIEKRLQSTKGSGAPLPADTKTAMESNIGADFSKVRVHTGNEAASLSNDLQAQAFTHGNDIYFNEGKYDTASSTGRHLLAHELTHTVQQGAAVQKKEIIQRVPDAGAPPTAASGEVVNISSGAFNPSENLKEVIRASKRKGVDVNISGGNLAGTGVIKVREKEGVLESIKNAYLPLNMPMFSAASPMLAIRLDNGQISGFATIGQNDHIDTIPKWLTKHGKELSWLTGIDVAGMAAQFTNKFETGAFTFTLSGVDVKVGGFASAKLDFGFVNMQPTAHVIANMDIKGVVKSNLDINLKEGKLSGEGQFGVDYKSFSGNIEAKFLDGVLDVKGQVGYSGDRLSGSIMLIMTDKATADNFAVSQVGKGKAEDAVLPESVPPAEGKGERALAGMGTLTFNLTEWFAGTVNVIVDGKGFVTVVGKIAPPKEIILFEQKDYIKELFKFEARASYGIPVVGNVFVFANIGLSALAKVGPAKIYNIEVNGTYSNNPDIAREISLSGSLNMSAYAGLRLRAEGGAGLELLGHDLKIGVGVNADAGVKGYVDARPTIGYRDPGEFFFKGHMEIAAQPFLGLSGDLFVEIDSPWWSPLPDKKWTWPIGALEYPLPGEFGIGADMEYVLGSGKVPEVTFSEAKFDGAKFMTDLVDDHVPQKSGGGKGDKQGKFVDGGAAAPPAEAKGTPPPAAPGKPAPAPEPGKGGGKGKGKDKDKGKENPEELKNFAAAMKQAKTLESRKPMTRAEITTEVDKIKKQHNVQGISFAPKGNDLWIITGTINGKPNKDTVKVKADRQPGDDKDDAKDKEKEKLLADGMKALIKEDDTTAGGDDALTKEEAQKVADKVEKSQDKAFKSITPVEKDGHWRYDYIQRTLSPPASKVATTPTIPPEFKEGAYINFGGQIYLITKMMVGEDKINILDVRDIRKNKNKKPEKGKLKLDDEKTLKLSIVVSKGIITEYNDPIPAVRKFPASWGSAGSESVRKYLYEYRHPWDNKQKQMIAHPARGVTPLLDIAKIAQDKALKGDDTEWKQIKKHDPTNTNPNDPIMIVDWDADFKTWKPDPSIFTVDHIKDLGGLWTAEGYNTDDVKRGDHVVGDNNLRVITQRHNSKKKGKNYSMFVGPDFTSVIADGGIRGAKTITGPGGKGGAAEPFL
ncbi:eCIS core domain-containing protein [Chitinophaga tropicalis]|uniref:DUF4157 domain-containing protein n=1 Tax=Chitinophaga tropicalis TaxID=2683588 RepID=A0A7K1U1W3_9BACT|nr:DUF4157 domain-containing protein [Chitinophaga tropicalis]MVT08328.1 DUF4157 domain-containing protein [Chitinophaga tropicalis]